ncbi:hypothetical protein BB561_002350 [Smittium simulii]|uniref:COX assembly mitochondrial protein n=1 Tax=Smittium simulii TaxID=133385 RepID=A0A2T9YQP5_9FUNG|nr:hypothetical protein BB561_002350 [Smittium simulii]
MENVKGFSVLSRRQEEEVRKLQRKEVYRLCDSIIKDFVDCSKARTVTVFWACKEQKKNMAFCLAEKETSELLDQVRHDYLYEKKILHKDN